MNIFLRRKTMNDGPYAVMLTTMIKDTIDIKDLIERAYEQGVYEATKQEYDEELLVNENEQAFLDAGHFYGL